jgi:hypothetical protein
LKSTPPGTLVGSKREATPERLYHYTDATGLLGIVRSGVIWASNAGFLNDSSELVHVKHVYGSVTEKLKDKYDLAGINNLLDALGRISIDIATQNYDVFVSCFCATGDLLSQWRGYPPWGGGYAIGFSAARLPKLPPLLRRVVYDEEEQATLLKTLVEPMCVAVAESPENSRIQLVIYERVLAAVATGLTELGFAFKHPGFRESRSGAS